jgi:hypothetical protein
MRPIVCAAGRGGPAGQGAEAARKHQEIDETGQEKSNQNSDPGIFHGVFLSRPGSRTISTVCSK